MTGNQGSPRQVGLPDKRTMKILPSAGGITLQSILVDASISQRSSYSKRQSLKKKSSDALSLKSIIARDKYIMHKIHYVFNNVSI